jgi:hypothetical protein
VVVDMVLLSIALLEKRFVLRNVLAHKEVRELVKALTIVLGEL